VREGRSSSNIDITQLYGAPPFAGQRLTITATSSAGAQSCTGDCNLDATVTVDELLTGVSIALGERTLTGCQAFDPNDDGMVTVDEILRAVQAALGDALETAIGECLQPGPVGLTRCRAGTVIKVFECADLKSCVTNLTEVVPPVGPAGGCRG
jgi:hypothetical protein